MEPIDISSDSDSDLEIKDGEEFDTSPEMEYSNDRILPSWATSPDASSRSPGYGVMSSNISSSRRGSTSNGNSSHVHDNSLRKFQNQPSAGDINRPSQADDDMSFLSFANFDQSRRVNPQIANVSGTDYEKLSSQQVLKRTFQASLEPSAYSSRSDNFADGASSSQAHNIYRSMHHPAGSSPSNNRAYKRDQYGRSIDNELINYEKNGSSRILPSSLMHGKFMLPAPSVVTSDSVPRSMAGDERVAGSDERLIFQAALEVLYQPKSEADLPEGLLSVPLLRHQKIALAWMLQRETRSLHCLGGILADDQGLGKTISMIALIQMQKSLESSSKSEDHCNRKTEALNLDEDDDNGESAADKLNQIGESADTKAGVDKVNHIGGSADTKPVAEGSTSTRTFSGRRPAAGTLVVCPASVVRQWARELDDKVATEAKLDILVYHGGGRTKDPVELAKYDVVVTTYSIVTNEVPKQPLVDEDDVDGEFGLALEFSSCKKRKKITNVTAKRKRGKKGIDNYAVDCSSGPLARVGWARVILDEAQTIKNHRTQVARACCSLRAKRRWCLSGTPIQNTIDDLYSYFRFLRYEPYNIYKSFYNTIKVPISRNALNGYKKLQVVLRAILLRRTKETIIDGQPIINLPPKSICLNKVDFSMEERAFYTWLEAESRSKFKAFAAAGTLKQNYANILLMLLRLRQACDHPFLVKGSSSDSGGKRSAEMAKRLPREMVIDLLNHFAASSAICLVCNDPPEDPVVTMCGHVFCYQCVSEYLTGDDNMCPARGCKDQLGSDIVFSEDTLRSCAAADLDATLTRSACDDESMVWKKEYSSSKIRSVLEILFSNCLRSPKAELDGCTESNGTGSPTGEPIKTIIFSQWTGMLDLVGNSLEEYCINYRRLDGTMSLAARDRAVKDFNTDPQVTVMIMSLKAGNLGLNMVAASHVILLDLWWNPTTEDQAIDRAHRIGQTRPVTVTRLTIKDTVEDRILALQEEKRKMVDSAFGDDQGGGSATHLTVQDLRYLFNV